MSYNGIGLSSVRGSATSGHVQANRGHVNANRLRRQQERNSQSNSRPTFNPVSSAARQQGHAEIQKHEERRRIENELLELQEEMEDAGKLSPEEINERIGRERTRLMNRLEGKHEQGNRMHQGQPQSRGQRWDRRKTAANQILKTQQSDRLGSALGIQRDAHVEGQAFDIDFQQQKKVARQARSEQEKKLVEEQEKRSRKEAKAQAKEVKKHGGRKRRSAESDSSSDESSGSSSSNSTSESGREPKRRRRSDSSSSSKSS
ncbi:cwf21 domain [Fragilaria crotonensis]|nr:cwf21 domain [Fragilaria crotonensis]KAI2504537.1 cwf21 domain [Fragilaria crotonensis]